VREVFIMGEGDQDVDEHSRSTHSVMVVARRMTAETTGIGRGDEEEKEE
jgi:hypothetical protein